MHVAAGCQHQLLPGRAWRLQLLASDPTVTISSLQLIQQSFRSLQGLAQAPKCVDLVTADALHLQ